MVTGAKKLTKWMEQRGLSKTEAAKCVGVSRPALLMWLRGVTRPKTHHRSAIERWTGGEIAADDWLTPTERKALDRVETATAAE